MNIGHFLTNICQPYCSFTVRDHPTAWINTSAIQLIHCERPPYCSFTVRDHPTAHSLWETTLQLIHCERPPYSLNQYVNHTAHSLWETTLQLESIRQSYCSFTVRDHPTAGINTSAILLIHCERPPYSWNQYVNHTALSLWETTLQLESIRQPYCSFTVRDHPTAWINTSVILLIHCERPPYSWNQYVNHTALSLWETTLQLESIRQPYCSFTVRDHPTAGIKA